MSDFLLGLAAFVGAFVVLIGLLIVFSEYGPIIAVVGMVALIVGMADLLGATILAHHRPLWAEITAGAGLVMALFGAAGAEDEW